MKHIPLRRVELGAGAAAATLGLLTLPMSLFAPLFPVCAAPPTATGTCPASATRYIALVAAHPGAGVLALLVALMALTLASAALAVADARREPGDPARRDGHWGRIALWGTALIIFAVSAMGSRGPLGLLYLPSSLVLALAAYVSLLRRMAARRAAGADAEDAARDAL